MRCLCTLVLGCLLSNGAWGAHNERSHISDSYKRAERTAIRFDDIGELEKTLNSISSIAPENFFLFLHIYAYGIKKGYVHIIEICETKIKATDLAVVGIGSSSVETCFYYFEELFCIGYTHEFTPYALRYLQPIIEAMIAFLKNVSTKEAEDIVKLYEECRGLYSADPDTYEINHKIPHSDEDLWTFPTNLQW